MSQLHNWLHRITACSDYVAGKLHALVALILELHELLMVVLQYRNRKEDCMDTT
jgi:hypothetical protein